GASRPAYLHEDVELIVGDVCDAAMVCSALEGVDAVFHFAAMVGVGQSMYEVARYARVNDVGTAVLLEALIERPVERLVVASSMSIYGEGLYRSAAGVVEDGERTREQLRRGEWEVRGPGGEVLAPVATPEWQRPSLASVDALSKYDQERLCLMIGAAYGIPAVALRFFNVYGPRQALSNPYTGVLAIFAARVLNGRAPLIFEDGLQQRDLVSVYDVARACVLALEQPEAAGAVLNVGRGRAYTIREVAARGARALGGREGRGEVRARCWVGDSRHGLADIAGAREVRGYAPRVSLDDGLAELGGWLDGQLGHERVDEASAELAVRGLTV